MIVVLMTKALIAQIQKWMDYNARIEETVANILAFRTQGSQDKPQAKAEPHRAKVEEEEVAVAAS